MPTTPENLEGAHVGDIISIPRYEGERFRIDDIRKGGMGVVYLLSALRASIGPVALKTFADSDNARAFEKECMSWMLVSSHPNVATVKWVGDVGGKLALLLHRYPHTLADLLGRDLTFRVRLSIATGIVQGLAYTARNGLLHRDIKPSNILLDNRMVPSVADFGLACKLSADMLNEVEVRGILLGDSSSSSEAVAICGTPFYMAPELLRREAVPSLITDMYSLGWTLHDLLVGVHRVADVKVRLDNKAYIASLRKAWSSTPEATPLLDMIERCTSRQPSNRPQSYEEVLTSLGVQAAFTPSAGDILEAELRQVVTLRESKNYQKALRALEVVEARYANPDARIINTRGLIHTQLGDQAAALGCFMKAHELLRITAGAVPAPSKGQRALCLAPTANAARIMIGDRHGEDAMSVLREAYGWVMTATRDGTVPPDTIEYYPEFGWMLIREAQYDAAAAHLARCFASKVSHDADTQWFVYAAARTGRLCDYAGGMAHLFMAHKRASGITALCGVIAAAWMPSAERTMVLDHLAASRGDVVHRLRQAGCDVMHPLSSRHFLSMMSALEQAIVTGVDNVPLQLA